MFQSDWLWCNVNLSTHTPTDVLSPVSWCCGNRPEYECWVPDCSDVPATLQIPSFLLMAFLKVLATSELFSPWTICRWKHQQNVWLHLKVSESNMSLTEQNLTSVNSSKVSLSLVFISSWTISRILYPGSGRLAALKRSWSSSLLMNPLLSTSESQRGHRSQKNNFYSIFKKNLKLNLGHFLVQLLWLKIFYVNLTWKDQFLCLICWVFCRFVVEKQTQLVCCNLSV